MNKKVSFGTKPELLKIEKPKADEWVKNREIETMKRLTIDVPASLHAQIKSQCAIKGVKMADEVRSLLEQHFVKM